MKYQVRQDVQSAGKIIIVNISRSIASFRAMSGPCSGGGTYGKLQNRVTICEPFYETFIA